MAMSLLVKVHAFESHAFQSIFHVSYILRLTHVISRVSAVVSLAKLNHKHTIFRQSIEQRINEFIILVKVSHNFDKLIRIQRIHNNDIKQLLLNIILLPIAVREPPKRVLERHVRPRIVKARIRIAPLHIRTVRPLRQMLPTKSHQLPVNLHHLHPFDGLVLQHLAQRGALASSDNGHPLGIGVGQHGGMNQRLVVRGVSVAAALLNSIEEKNFLRLG
mmetsp:Transcript_17095/g.30696  ORF Transcript_17095/g.30696 Transcript_17095/m.30696 type:complete len:218 (+) Transcript_17095:1097-1750(+)